MGKLHRGELEVIAGAKELNLDYLLIMKNQQEV